jgi:hypothetical protein
MVNLEMRRGFQHLNIVAAVGTAGCVMPKTASSHVDKYRQQAAELRRRAQSTRSHDEQTRLRAMADGFDRLADHAEARQSLMAATD